MVIIVGAIDSKPYTLAIVDSGRTVPAVSEEQFCRMKMAHGMLHTLYAYVMARCGSKAEKHKGKITGSDALGKPTYAETLKKIVRDIEEAGMEGQAQHNQNIQSHAVRLLSDRYRLAYPSTIKHMPRTVRRLSVSVSQLRG